MTTDPTLVALDANILAKPVTRTLLLVGGMPSGFIARWSAAAEQEATRHMRSRAITPVIVRERFGIELSATGQNASRFTDTKEADRQILADAAAAKARFLITEDVDDFALSDLAGLGISAVNPDLFLAAKLTRTGYVTVIDLFVQRQVNPPTTSAQFHAAIARKHPRLFTAHADLYDTTPEVSGEAEPKAMFRGNRCLNCEDITTTSITHPDGLCHTCQ